jgi:hypothetical protein
MQASTSFAKSRRVRIRCQGDHVALCCMNGAAGMCLGYVAPTAALTKPTLLSNEQTDKIQLCFLDLIDCHTVVIL